MDKLFSFTTSHILETKVSGSLLAHICGSFAKVNPELTLHRFVPHLVKTILSLIAQGDVKNEDNLDKELLYYLQILGGVSDLSIHQFIFVRIMIRPWKVWKNQLHYFLNINMIQVDIEKKMGRNRKNTPI